MAYKLIIKEETVADIQQAYEYYEENKTGLGNHFLAILDDYFEQIQKHPLHYQIKKNHYREAVIKNFLI